MLPTSQRWWIYRPRVVLYLAMLLLAWLAPRCFLGPVLVYLGEVLGFIALGAIGINPTFQYFMSEAQPAPRGLWRALALIGAMGVTLALLGRSWPSDTLQILGGICLFGSIEGTLLSLEANRRYLLRTRVNRVTW